MRFNEETKIKGAFLLTVLRSGIVVEEYHDPNMIMNVAKAAMAKLIAGAGAGKTITTIGFGTNQSGPTPIDTLLTGSYSKLVASISYPSIGQVSFNWALAEGEANGTSIKEFGLICSDGTLFARKTRGAIEKQSDISLTGSWTIIF